MELAIFLLGGYTSLVLASFAILAAIVRPRGVGHWIGITLASAAWPITLMMILAI